MSRQQQSDPQGASPPDPAEAEGWESLAEESGGSLAPNPELEEALREASDAMDAAEGRSRPKGPESAEPYVEDLSARLVETEDRLLRLQADFENFRRRALKERQEIVRYGHQNLVKDLLSTVDNLDRAIDHVNRSEGEEDLESLLKGVELVRKELLGALAKHGITEIPAAGAPFDPALHEAMAQSADDSVPVNTVVDVLQKGYRLRDRVIRPARVVVAAASGDASGASGNSE